MRVVLESPYAGDRILHVAYAKRALKDSLLRGESPIMSHLLHTQVLDDSIPDERKMGIAAGTTWFYVADAIVFYVDYGMSTGMKMAYNLAHSVQLHYNMKLKIIERKILS